MKIFKYTAPVMHGEFSVAVPFGARFLKFGFQDMPCLWFAVDPNQQLATTKNFRIIFTGEEIGDQLLRYVDTVQANGIVMHLHEVMD